MRSVLLVKDTLESTQNLSYRSVSEVGAGLQGAESTAVIQSVLSDMGKYISQAL